FLLFFIFWELVGLSSFLLIGFWYHKPSAVAASQKAFLVTRIGDFGLLIGMILLTSSAGNFLFYDEGKGCLETQALLDLLGPAAIGGLTIAGLISLLVFFGAMSKSGQVPFHVWLPDAMEGPTPVSALIHAATMVAAGVFLVARLFPLFDLDPTFVSGVSPSLSVVTWVGAITAFYAACVAVAQTDIKRILAYSTVSQLGYMMMALGVGGVAAGMFHLITHAFFKALLFLGAGSVIHGSHDEQDIRKMGGLRTLMPKTFQVYAIGMLALTGFPFLFSGFWSKEEILTTALHWPASKIPFLLGLCGAFLTAFYMSRQMIYVFHGKNRQQSGSGSIHESPGSMVIPMAVLAAFAVGLSVIGTPIWPWFEGFITGHPVPFRIGELFHLSHLALMVGSTALVFGGYFLAWKIYGSAQSLGENHPDRLSSYQPWLFGFLNRQCHVDELYQKIFVKPFFEIGQFCRTVEEKWNHSLTSIVSAVTLMISWCCRWVDDWLINPGFDYICDRSRRVAGRLSVLQNGQIQNYLRVGGLAIAFLMVIYVLGGMI
ncbi:MAG TPA: NADH-quinone oxidoreductase subunit L, partial [Verrucomicrobia bacterium]|nr:NADH-quinone oxidoreductase subunit L [Verrucomicrobiota bacterium]